MIIYESIIGDEKNFAKKMKILQDAFIHFVTAKLE